MYALVTAHNNALHLALKTDGCALFAVTVYDCVGVIHLKHHWFRGVGEAPA